MQYAYIRRRKVETFRDTEWTLSKGSPVRRAKTTCLMLLCVVTSMGQTANVSAERGSSASTANAEQIARVKDYYSGKRLTLVVSHASGGSTVAWAQVIAHRLSGFIPGNPRVVMVQRPGAGGLVATQYMLNQAAPDGYTVGAIGGSVVLEAATAGLKFNGKDLDVRDFRYVGGVGETGIVYGRKNVFPDGPSSLLKPAKAPIILGVPGVDHSSVISVAVLKVLGVDVERDLKLVRGYPDSAGRQIAMAQGEVYLDEVRASGYGAMVAPHVAHGEYVPLWQLGLIDGDKLVRQSGLNNIPTFLEVYDLLHKRRPPPSDALTYALWTAKSNALVRPIVLPPKTPDWIVAALREAFAKMVDDPDFLADQERILGQSGRIHIDGATAQAFANEMIGMSSEVHAIYKNFISQPPFKSFR
jgi:tripartite-type tricarboxylate transporter receptor subunit TctC